MRWLRALLGLHEHSWVMLEKHPIFEPGKDKPCNVDFILQCKHCGDIKSVRT